MHGATPQPVFDEYVGTSNDNVPDHTGVVAIIITSNKRHGEI